ncbi:tRNA threonylcarbamoyl adenosine modification protein YeaZ [Knoellia remsis]|uniref:tRNA threonylcarbamoyl adenosine modification protein YeaZ n=1 Tax=Knoellia remsis TaxID=407159 RepID=A0A2T0UJY6_9MICO|nr:tRNA (adenosine(37)-N6)-threonylcarbamoyltransferase complex dimerization subunit type 1 TsaB [Knoellia remsis]PRY58168.1 tRNA threonylcarbamoyl adenosine modification protein YeaZ [Knoellia remsis]
MLILAIDTSTSAITVALHDGTSALAQESHIDARAHTEWVAPLIQRCLTAADRRPEDLTDVVVGVGPGPFTGLRVGIVTGITMAHALDIPVHGVPSLDVLAEQAAPMVDGELLVATDARRKEVYWARYAVRARSVERLTDPAVDRPAELPEEVRALPTAGRGPMLYLELFPTQVPVLDVDAAVLGRLAAQRISAGEDMPVEPLYLRRPDALTTSERQGPKT